MISLDKKYKTRDGRRVRLYTTGDNQDIFPVHGAYEHPQKSGFWLICCWTIQGGFLRQGTLDSNLDLIEEP
jgi:hypothetical protein